MRSDNKFPDTKKKVHAKSLVFKEERNKILVNRVTTILKKDCLVVHRMGEGIFSEIEVNRVVD